MQFSEVLDIVLKRFFGFDYYSVFSMINSIFELVWNHIFWSIYIKEEVWVVFVLFAVI